MASPADKFHTAHKTQPQRHNIQPLLAVRTALCRQMRLSPQQAVRLLYLGHLSKAKEVAGQHSLCLLLAACLLLTQWLLLLAR